MVRWRLRYRILATLPVKYRITSRKCIFMHARHERIGTVLHLVTKVDFHPPEPNGDVVAPPGQTRLDGIIAMTAGSGRVSCHATRPDNAAPTDASLNEAWQNVAVSL